MFLDQVLTLPACSYHTPSRLWNPRGIKLGTLGGPFGLVILASVVCINFYIIQIYTNIYLYIHTHTPSTYIYIYVYRI